MGCEATMQRHETMFISVGLDKDCKPAKVAYQTMGNRMQIILI